MVSMKKHPTLGIMVRSDGLILLPTKPGHPEHWSKGVADGRGYYRIGYNSKTYSVHRLVAETFLENPDMKKYIDHIDRDKTNNDVSNLRWVTSQENLYNRKNTNIEGKRSCDMSKQEYKNMYLREWRKKQKEMKNV